MAIGLSMNVLKGRICSIYDRTKFLLNMNERLIRRYVEQRTVVGKKVEKLVKDVGSRFFEW